MPAKGKGISSDRKQKMVLLDSHAILHRAYHALPDFASSKGEPTGALYGLSTMLLKIVEELKPDFVIACYDVKGPTYRHDAYKDYKAQRKKTDDDLITQLNSSRKIFEAFNIPIYDKQGFEADDILGTIVEKIKYQKSNIKNKAYENLDIVIASGDMDTMQLITGTKVKVYTLKKGIKDTIIYDEEGVRARYGFGPELIADYKGLRGDPSDNIIGVAGIGEKTATILVTTFGPIENIYKELEAGHEQKFLDAKITPRIIQLLKDNKEEAEFSKTLATIRRDVPIDFSVPEKTFRENLDVQKVKTLWNELEFRTLGGRLDKLVGGKVDVPSSSIPVESTEPAESVLVPSISPDLIKKTAIALWLLNSNITNPTIEDITEYKGIGDSVKASEEIFKDLKEKKLDKVYEDIELPLLPIIEKMETRGIKVDKKVLKHLSETYHKKSDELQKAIWDIAGTEFNVSSPKQLGEILFDKLGLVGKNMKKTAGGARSTKESELEKLLDLHPIIQHIIEFRELQKLLGTYIDAIPPLLDQGDRVHTNLIQTGSATGRMASQNPGLQNIPIKTELGKAIRTAFIAEKGYVLAGFDYSQMEIRIAAFLSGDKKLIEIFRNNEDVHTSVAAQVFKVPMNEVTSDMRRKAKVINFGIMYGMGVTALQKNLGTNRAEAQQFLSDYFETFSGLAAYLDRTKVEAAQNGYTETLFGRRRYFEGIHSKLPFIRAAAERMAINAPIQGTEADLIKLAMIKIDAYLVEKKWDDKVFPLLQVHDELIYEIEEGLAKEVSKEITKLMESVIDTSKTAGIIMKADAHIGDNWGELK